MPLALIWQRGLIWMKIKSFLAKPSLHIYIKVSGKILLTAVEDQENILRQLVKTGRNTEYGKEHGLINVNTYEEFKQAVPIRDYEQMRPTSRR